MPLQTQQLLESEQFVQGLNQELRDPITQVHAAAQASDMPTLDSIKRLDEDHEMHGIEHFPQQPVELSARDFPLERSHRENLEPSQLANNKVDSTRDAVVSKGAAGLVKILMRMAPEQEGELSGQTREVFQDMLLKAFDMLSLSEDSAGTADKAGWIHCEFCPKQTRLRCEMK
jgi:hypothetical protein